jgi:hypothetical protein
VPIQFGMVYLPFMQSPASVSYQQEDSVSPDRATSPPGATRIDDLRGGGSQVMTSGGTTQESCASDHSWPRRSKSGGLILRFGW